MNEAAQDKLQDLSFSVNILDYASEKRTDIGLIISSDFTMLQKYMATDRLSFDFIYSTDKKAFMIDSPSLNKNLERPLFIQNIPGAYISELLVFDSIEHNLSIDIRITLNCRIDHDSNINILILSFNTEGRDFYYKDIIAAIPILPRSEIAENSCKELRDLSWQIQESNKTSIIAQNQKGIKLRISSGLMSINNV